LVFPRKKCAKKTMAGRQKRVRVKGNGTPVMRRKIQKRYKFVFRGLREKGLVKVRCPVICREEKTISNTGVFPKRQGKKPEK